MGLIKGGLFWVVAIVLFFSLLALNAFATLSLSLGYDNVRENLIPMISENSLENSNLIQALNSSFAHAETYCRNNSEYVFFYQGYAVDVECDVVNEGYGAFFDESVNDVVYGVYYEDYDCGLWDCLKEERFPFFLVSEKSQDYWQGKFYSVLIASLILAGFLFLLMDKRVNWPIALGSIMVISILPLLKFENFFASIAGLLTPVTGDALGIFFDIFFSRTRVIFWIMLLLGLVFIGLWISLKFVNIGFIRKWIEKDSKAGEATKITTVKNTKIRKQKK